MPLSIFNNKNFRTFVRIVLGIIFIYASLDKIAHPQEFAKIIYYYRILPAGWENLIAIFLPWMEFIIGLFLVVYKWVRGSLIFYNILLIVFILALLQAQVRGLDIACGCFSVDPSSKSEVWLRIILDVVMLFFSINLAFAENKFNNDDPLDADERYQFEKNN